MATSQLKQQYPPSKLQSLGRDLYSQGKYEEAVEAFTALIETSNGRPACSILALRAAAHEKLKNPSMALKDGKKMIELDPGNAQGYLITAHLLRSLQNDALALKIYQRGLRHCKDSYDCAKLQLKMSRVSGDVGAAASVDPVQLLPPELLEMVLTRLPFATLCNCLKVSKLWREQLSRQTSLWTFIDLSAAKKPVRRQDLM